MRTNGPAGLRIQTPSARFLHNFQEDVTIATASVANSGVQLSFAAWSNLPASGSGQSESASDTLGQPATERKKASAICPQGVISDK